MSELVYLLHFERPHPDFKRAIQHYLGRTINLDKRVKLHRSGQGAALCRQMGLAGINFKVARTWHPEATETATQLERRLKGRKKASQLCPICRGAITTEKDPFDGRAGSTDRNQLSELALETLSSALSGA